MDLPSSPLAPWGDVLKDGAFSGARLAILAGLMVLAGLGAVCLSTILGASMAVSAAVVIVLIGAFVGALLGAARRFPLPRANHDGGGLSL